MGVFLQGTDINLVESMIKDVSQKNGEGILVMDLANIRGTFPNSLVDKLSSLEMNWTIVINKCDLLPIKHNSDKVKEQLLKIIQDFHPVLNKIVI